jgi:hypothetical protein
MNLTAQLPAVLHAVYGNVSVMGRQGAGVRTQGAHAYCNEARASGKCSESGERCGLRIHTLHNHARRYYWTLQARIADPRLSFTYALNLPCCTWENFPLASNGKVAILTAPTVQHAASNSRDSTISRIKTLLKTTSTCRGRLETPALPPKGSRAPIVAITPRLLDAAYSG